MRSLASQQAGRPAGRQANRQAGWRYRAAAVLAVWVCVAGRAAELLSSCAMRLSRFFAAAASGWCWSCWFLSDGVAAHGQTEPRPATDDWCVVYDEAFGSL